MAVCTIADQSRRYDRSYPGGYVPGSRARGVLHTTETLGIPSYSGGADAPHFTVDPRTGKIWQHFDTARPSRALKHPPGTIDTNNMRAIQIEIIAYSDPVKAAQVGGLRIDHLTPAQLAPIAKLMRWIETYCGVSRASGLRFLQYPASAGLNNGVRFSTAGWVAFPGWCGHMHVVNNDHGDPSDVAMTALLAQVLQPPTPGGPVIQTSNSYRGDQPITQTWSAGLKTGGNETASTYSMAIRPGLVRGVVNVYGRCPAPQGITVRAYTIRKNDAGVYVNGHLFGSVRLIPDGSGIIAGQYALAATLLPGEFLRFQAHTDGPAPATITAIGFTFGTE